MVTRGELISAGYLEQQKALHAAPRGYGGRGEKWADTVYGLVRAYQASSVLDYGCGQGTLVKALRSRLDGSVRLAEYDPAIPGKDGIPSFADLVCCCDVLEHIEPDKLNNVLDHLRALARLAVFVVIATRPSNKVLTSGENAHLTIQDGTWWRDRVLSRGFTLMPTKEQLPEVPGKHWIGLLKP